MNKAHSLLLKYKNKTPNLKPKLGYCITGRYKKLRLRGRQYQAPNLQRDAHTGGMHWANLPKLTGTQSLPSLWILVGLGRNSAAWSSRNSPTGKDSQKVTWLVSLERSSLFFKVSEHRSEHWLKKTPNILGFLLVGKHCCLLCFSVWLASYCHSAFPVLPTCFLSKICPGFLFLF